MQGHVVQRRDSEHDAGVACGACVSCDAGWHPLLWNPYQ
jgi:hypothetical protein